MSNRVPREPSESGGGIPEVPTTKMGARIVDMAKLAERDDGPNGMHFVLCGTERACEVMAGMEETNQGKIAHYALDKVTDMLLEAGSHPGSGYPWSIQLDHTGKFGQALGGKVLFMPARFLPESLVITRNVSIDTKDGQTKVFIGLFTANEADEMPQVDHPEQIDTVDFGQAGNRLAERERARRN